MDVKIWKCTSFTTFWVCTVKAASKPFSLLKLLSHASIYNSVGWTKILCFCWASSWRYIKVGGTVSRILSQRRNSEPKTTCSQLNRSFTRPLNTKLLWWIVTNGETLFCLLRTAVYQEFGLTTTSCDEHLDMAKSLVKACGFFSSVSLTRHTTTFLSKPRTNCCFAAQTTLLPAVATSWMFCSRSTRTGMLAFDSAFSTGASSRSSSKDKIKTSLYFRPSGVLLSLEGVKVPDSSVCAVNTLKW